MYQSFEDSGGPENCKERTELLRAELKKRGLYGFLIPHSDEYQSEYLAASAERLAWLTGFTGSAGFAILLEHNGYLFVDGRYTLQAREQSASEIFSSRSLIEEPPAKWLEKNLKPGLKIGYDPRLHTIQGAKSLRKACKKAGGELISLETNPLDTVWTDQPASPLGKVAIQNLEFAGETAHSKLTRIDKKLEEARSDALVLTLADSIAWTFNIRGRDIAHNPVPLCTAILRRDEKPVLVIDKRKVDKKAGKYLEEICSLAEPEALAMLLKDLKDEKITIQLDPNSANAWFAQNLKHGNAKIKLVADPVIAMKAIKNDAEISGARTAHIRDGAALCRFLCWLENAVETSSPDEIGAAGKLEKIRAETGELRDISFDTISAMGSHGAIVHYRVSKASNRRIEPDSLYLVDSGGQYEDGTTDITRTLAIGKPSPEMRKHFTLVLKGHIAIATARFPTGTNGAQIDAFARRFLWDEGLDYAHGTGHGVGSYLAVHEGPQSISKRGATALKPGMIVSNEPGYYKEGEYGIRIENLVMVRQDEKGPDGLDFLSFEMLSFTPIDLALVDASLLSDSEIEWLNDYHNETREKLLPLLTSGDKDWLEQATRHLTR